MSRNSSGEKKLLKSQQPENAPERQEKGNCKSRVAIVLLSCMSEDRESFSCHIYYFVIINCIISPGWFFFAFARAKLKKTRAAESKLFHFDSLSRSPCVCVSVWVCLFSFNSLFFYSFLPFSGKTHDYSTQCTIYNIGSEHILIWIEFDWFGWIVSATRAPVIYTKKQWIL